MNDFPIMLTDEELKASGPYQWLARRYTPEIAEKILRGHEQTLLSKLRIPIADERAVCLFREALAWGYVYGPNLNKDQWERMRDETAQQFSQRLAGKVEQKNE